MKLNQSRWLFAKALSSAAGTALALSLAAPVLADPVLIGVVFPTQNQPQGIKDRFVSGATPHYNLGRDFVEKGGLQAETALKFAPEGERSRAAS